MTIPLKYEIESRVLAAARARIDKIAEEYREKVLVPFCRLHKLTYIAGNGRTVFYTTDGRTFGSAGDLDAESYTGIDEIFDALDQPAIGRDDCFGFYVSDVRDADIGVRRGRR